MEGRFRRKRSQAAELKKVCEGILADLSKEKSAYKKEKRFMIIW